MSAAYSTSGSATRTSGRTVVLSVGILASHFSRGYNGNFPVAATGVIARTYLKLRIWTGVRVSLHGGLDPPFRGGIEERLERLAQLPGREGLADVRVSPDSQPVIAVERARSGGEQHERGVRRGRLLLEPADHLVAVEVGHHDVQHAGIWLALERDLEGVAAVARRDHVEA